MIEKIIGYNFQDKDLLRLALTHRSKSAENYERLEFLGDSILSLCISKYLFDNTHYQEGSLSVLRADLVSRTKLNQTGLELGIDTYIRTANKQNISNNIRADVIESIIAAMYLDGGLDPCTQFITDKVIATSTLNPSKDSKTKLQEWTHKHKRALPKYILLSTTGLAHQLEYTAECRLCCGLSAQAKARTKQEAEQKAAKTLYQQLMEEQS